MNHTILYYAPSTASLVVHWLLIELDVPHQLSAVDLPNGQQKSPEYLKLNPLGVVPTLVQNGVAQNEAGAICMQLADQHRAQGLAPEIGSLERAAYYSWMAFCANTLQPAYRAWFYPAEPAGEEHQVASKAHAEKKLLNAWNLVDQHLQANGPYLLGEKISAADFMLTMLMRWSRNMPKPAHTWPAVSRLATLMKARPSFQEVYRREGLTDWT